jgi:hypothetical protein
MNGHTTTTPWNETTLEVWGDKHGRKLCCYFNPNGTAVFVKSWGADIDTEMADGTFSTTGEMCALLLWVNGVEPILHKGLDGK